MPTGPPGLSGPPGGSVFGPFIGPSQVRDAAQATLTLWAPTYVAEAARRVGADLAGFNDWLNEAGISPVGGDARPRYSVYCPGTLGEPRKEGDGTYRAVWDVQVNLWLYGADWQTTEDTLGWYMTALVMALLQHPSMGGFAEGIAWRGVRYEPVEERALHTWGRGVALFAASVRQVLDAHAGPATVPAPDPTVAPPPDPTVTGAGITVTHP